MAAQKLEIIAELAQGFEGKPLQAQLLLKAAATAKADAAKFQLVYADELATPDYKYFELFKTLEMPDAEWALLAEQAKGFGLGLQLDIFGRRSLDLASKLGISAVKLHGTDTSNIGFLEEIAKANIDRVILGAGGATSDENLRAVEILSGKKIVIMLGFQAYPTPVETNQISRVVRLVELFRENTDVQVGFADHVVDSVVQSVALASAAIGAGATVIEKHLTLGRVMEMEDYESALNPDEFSDFVQAARQSFSAFGKTESKADFGMSAAEMGYREMIRRHVVAKVDLPSGYIITHADVELKRTSAENPLFNIESVYGKKIGRPVAKGQPVLESDLD